MPPVVGTSFAEWSSAMGAHLREHQEDEGPHNHVFLSSAALPNNSSPQPAGFHGIMPSYEDGITGPFIYNLPTLPCSNILDRNSFEEFSYHLTSSRNVLNLDEDEEMTSPLWSTASNKKLILEVPDCWESKPVRSWTEQDTAEWFHSLGASQDLVHEERFCMSGEVLANMCHMDRKCIMSLENELRVQIYHPLQELLGHPDTNTPLPAFDALCNGEIKQEDNSQLEFSQPWQSQEYPDSTFKREYCSSEGESESEQLRVAEPSRGVRTGRRGRPPSTTSKAAKRKLEKRHGRLWEFIRDLLKNPEYCPSLICWEDHDEGVFRFVSSEKVAQLWGSKRGNTKMTYEKLSRAMRYYYKSNILQPVTHRRLVYRFGPKATNWRHPNPNFRKPV